MSAASTDLAGGVGRSGVVRPEAERDDGGVGYRDPGVRAWLEEAGARLLEHLVRGPRREDRVVRYTPPEEAHAAFARHVGLGIRENDGPHPPEQILAALDDILERSVKAAHPRFFNQNWAGADPVSVLGDWLTALLNTTAATYEMAPLFTLMENELLGRMSELVGFAPVGAAPRLTPGAHGMFVPGGALSNLYAMHAARVWASPEAADEGLFGGPRLVGFTSSHSHYSFGKAAKILGLGRAGAVEIPCDEVGRMIPEALEAKIAEARAAGARPFFVNATAGTTVAGAFDPIDALADIAEREELWLHVDGCYGGTALFSERHRHLLEGAHRARSFAWNPHKMMGMTQQCAVLLMRAPEILAPAFGGSASYIFQEDKNDADMDLGALTLQCGRRADGVKLWLTWKARGEAWFGDRLEHAVRLAERLEARIRGDARFALAFPRTFANVGFWWVPPDMRPLDPERPLDAAAWHRLHALAPRIKDALQREGSALLGYQPLDDRPNFFRLLVMSPDVTFEDIEATLETLDRLGRAVEAGATASSWLDACCPSGA